MIFCKDYVLEVRFLKLDIVRKTWSEMGSVMNRGPAGHRRLPDFATAADGEPSSEASGVAVSGHRRRHFWRPPPPSPPPATGCEKLILYSFFIIFRKNRVLEVQFLKLDILCKT